MIKSFKVELNPNNKQKTLFYQYAGTARFSYNWALDLLKKDYESGNKKIKPSAITLHKLLVEKKNNDPEFSWMKNISKWCPQNSLRNLETAYNRFFQKKSQFPKKKKKGIKDSFTLDIPIYVYNNRIQLPKIGIVRLKEKGYIPEGSPKSATISLKAGRWFVSVSYEMPKINHNNHINESIGVDLGIKNLATFSDGTIIPKNTKLKDKEKKLKRLQRKLCRQQKGSKSRDKTKKLLQTLHYHISNTRKDILHKTTSLLAKTKLEKTIVIEDLNVSGMMKNHCLAKAIANIGAYEFRRQLEYKCDWYGKELIIADRWFPSSKMDHKSGIINKDLKLSDRVIIHDDGSFTDRDLNAAINLRDYGNKNTARYAGILSFAETKKDKKAGGDKRFISSQEERCLSVKPENKTNI